MLKNKLLCAEQIELALGEEIANNELILKAYKNFSILMQVYHDKNQDDYNVDIVFDYDTLNKNKKNQDMS